MSTLLCHRRRRGHRAPLSIDTPARAFELVAAAIHRPMRAEVIAILLAADRTATAVMSVTDTFCDDSVITVADYCVGHCGQVGATGLVLASVRPSGDLCYDDVDRWLEMSSLAEAEGLTLYEWWVIGTSVNSPRDHLGEAPRW